MKSLTWWLRVVGAFYVLQFVVMAIAKAPIRVQGPAGVLARAASGDPTARFLVDTWVTFALEVGAIGMVLLFASRIPEQAKILVWTIIAIELSRGIVADVYLIARGEPLNVLVPWLFIHTAVIVSGLAVVRAKRSVPEVAVAHAHAH
jgi:hypothetical protein